jgi:hypothetical protein
MQLLQPDDDETLLSDKQLKQRLGGISSMCLWRWRNSPRVALPRPIQIYGRNYTPLGTIRRWQRERGCPGDNDVGETPGRPARRHSQVAPTAARQSTENAK